MTYDKIRDISQKAVKIKICGMKNEANILEIAALLSDYLGFIFVKDSPRYFEGTIPTLPKSIKKTGVFVDESLDQISKMVLKYDLQAVQLHGQESIDFCEQLREKLSAKIEIIKAFAVDGNFDFDHIKSYDSVCDYYLFDTKGKLAGGNGKTFDWSILEKYKSKKQFFLSGGIGVNEIQQIHKILNSNLPIYAIDCNSKLESEPGIKDLKLSVSFFNSFKK